MCDQCTGEYMEVLELAVGHVGHWTYRSVSRISREGSVLIWSLVGSKLGPGNSVETDLIFGPE